MKISDIEIRLCRRGQGTVGDTALRDGRGSDLEFLVISITTDDGLRVSSFGFAAVYRVTEAGDVSEVMTDVPQADIGIDVGRGRVLIPQLDQHRLIIHPLPRD